MVEGWKCPVCGKGLAPWVSVCPCWQERATIWVPSDQPQGTAEPMPEVENTRSDFKRLCEIFWKGDGAKRDGFGDYPMVGE
jgi:hypothetical protein